MPDHNLSELIELITDGKQAKLALALGGTAGIGRFADKPFGEKFGKWNNEKLALACNNWLFVDVKNQIAKEVKSEIIRDADSRINHYSYKENENYYRSKINEILANLEQLIHKQIPHPDHDVSANSVEVKKLEATLTQFIQVGQIALEPYVTGKKTGLENLANDMQEIFSHMKVSIISPAARLDMQKEYQHKN